MAIEACPHCQGAVDVPDVRGGGRFACPHCGGVVLGAGSTPVSSVSAEMETPPDGQRAIDPEKHMARIKVAMSLFRGRGRAGATTGRTDLGGAFALLGITIGVPALFVSPWLNPMVLGGGGMLLCLVGLMLSRDKLIPLLGIFIGFGAAAGGMLLQSHVFAMAEQLGLVEKLDPVEDPNAYHGESESGTPPKDKGEEKPAGD